MITESIVGELLHSYRMKPLEESDVVWLAREFQMRGADSEESAKRRAADVQKSIDNYRKAVAELQLRLEHGESRTKYLQDMITHAASMEGVTNVAEYAGKIDDAVSQANQMMWDTVHRKGGEINQARTLHGNIAEADLAGRTTINQAVEESPFVTVQPRVNERGSADTSVIDLRTGSIVSSQQMKFYSSAEKTLKAYLAGPYGANGQCLIAPADQVARIRELRPDIDVRASIDGRSKGLTYNDARNLQRDVQAKGVVHKRDWASADVGMISRHIGTKAVESGILAMGFQAARMAGRRIWNTVTGKGNKSWEEDFNEFGRSVLQSGTSAGMVTALAGGLEVAARRGMMGTAVKAASSSVIANLACVAVDNIRIINELGEGKITAHEALDKSCNNTCSMLGSLALGSKLASAVGSVFAPGIGTAIGAVVGGIVGSAGGQALYQGAKAAVKAVGGFVSRVVSGTYRTVSRVWNKVTSWFA